MFELSQDHEEFRSLVREFAEAEIEPRVAAWDRAEHFPVELIPKLGELGVFGLVVPHEYGGSRRAEGESHGGDFTMPVSYTHLDVYKRQSRGGEPRR